MALIIDCKFEIETRGKDNDGVALKMFGGGQGWGLKLNSACEAVNAIYAIIMRDNNMTVEPPRAVETDIKAGIARMLFEGELTSEWGG